METLGIETPAVFQPPRPAAKIVATPPIWTTSDYGLTAQPIAVVTIGRVIGLRLIKLSRGGRAAETEAVRTVTEKSNALTRLRF